MGIKVITDKDDAFDIEIGNGELRALNEIKEKFNFKDKQSALRFALAIMGITERNVLGVEYNDGRREFLKPSEDLINKEK